jgi:hypothetical protein
VPTSEAFGKQEAGVGEDHGESVSL